MRQAGRYLPEYRAIRQKHNFLEVCKTPELAIEVSLQPRRILGVDAVIVFSDILIPVGAMGLPFELSDKGPVIEYPLRTAAQIRELSSFDPEVETGFPLQKRCSTPNLNCFETCSSASRMRPRVTCGRRSRLALQPFNYLTPGSEN
jgi:hypothetical protein